MLTRSTKSVRSLHSLVSSDGGEGTSVKSSFQDPPLSNVFEELLPYVCKKFNCTFDLLIRKSKQAEQGARDGVKRFRKVTGMDTPAGTQRSKSEDVTVAADIDPNPIIMWCLYDNNNILVELLIENQPKIPRMLMQVIAIIAPMYNKITKITIRNCRIDAYTIYELKKIVALKHLTDVCLDDSSLPEANYAILLKKESSLRQLSLCRCSITDVVCQQIVSKLRYSAPAYNDLLILNLSGNQITDEGALYISEMLRTNRRLRFLNLAGNRIGDDGARYILDVLVEFPLTYDEIVEKRRIVLYYLKRKYELVHKFMIEWEMMASSSSCGVMSNTQDHAHFPKGLSSASGNISMSHQSQHSRTTITSPIFIKSNLKHRSNYTVKEKLRIIEDKVQANEKAEKLAIQYLGQLEPFNSNDIVLRKGWSHCTGNLTLSYLNISYNNLTYISAKKILDVLLYQSHDETGLLKIILQGNFMPESCQEYVEISALLNKKLLVKEDGKSREYRAKRKPHRSRATTASTSHSKK